MSPGMFDDFGKMIVASMILIAIADALFGAFIVGILWWRS